MKPYFALIISSVRERTVSPGATSRTSKSRFSFTWSEWNLKHGADYGGNDVQSLFSAWAFRDLRRSSFRTAICSWTRERCWITDLIARLRPGGATYFIIHEQGDIWNHSGTMYILCNTSHERPNPLILSSMAPLNCLRWIWPTTAFSSATTIRQEKGRWVRLVAQTKRTPSSLSRLGRRGWRVKKCPQENR